MSKRALRLSRHRSVSELTERCDAASRLTSVGPLRGPCYPTRGRHCREGPGCTTRGRLSPPDGRITHRPEATNLLKTTILLLVLAIIAAFVGFGDDRGLIVGLSRVAFFILLVFTLVSLVLGKSSRSV